MAKRKSMALADRPAAPAEQHREADDSEDDAADPNVDEFLDWRAKRSQLRGGGATK